MNTDNLPTGDASAFRPAGLPQMVTIMGSAGEDDRVVSLQELKAMQRLAHRRLLLALNSLMDQAQAAKNEVARLEQVISDLRTRQEFLIHQANRAASHF